MLSDHDVVLCGLCGARIRWTVTAAGRALSVNADADPAGNTAVYRDGTGRLRSRGLSNDRPVLEHAEWLARPHVATCANPLPRRRTPQRGSGRPQSGVRPAPWRRP